MKKRTYKDEVIPYLFVWSFIGFLAVLFIKEIIIENLFNIYLSITNFQILGTVFIFCWIILTILYFVGKQLLKNDELESKLKKAEFRHKYEIDELKREVEKLKN